MLRNKIKYILIFSLILFLLMSTVSAVEDNVANELSLDNINSESSQIDLEKNTNIQSYQNLKDSQIIEDSNQSNDLKINEKYTATENQANEMEINEKHQSNEKTQIKSSQLSEGEYVNASDAYKYLNVFRTEENVWYWNNDDTTKSHVNTNDTIWLQPLVRDVELENTAKIRAKQISEYFSHYLSNGSICFSIFPDDLLDYGENIAHGYENGYNVTEGWKETNYTYSGQGHRRNMIQADYNCVGIAGYKVNGTTYWVQNFGCRNNPQNTEIHFNFENKTSNPCFNINLTKYATGQFGITINGNAIIEKQIYNGMANFTLYGLETGTYDVELSYSGDHNYKSSHKTVTIVIPEDSKKTNGFSSLNTLIQMANDEVELDNDFIYDSNQDFDFKDGIIISKAITIDGKGHKIDANHLARIFKANNQVTLKNIILSNANGSSSKNNYLDESAIGVTSHYNSYSTTGNNGSGIYAISHLTIINSSFINSSAENGGAIYSNDDLEIYNSSFINNSVKENGGAIYSKWNTYIYDSNFTDNHAFDLGGAIYSTSNIESNNSNFKNNSNLQVFARNFKDNNNKFINDEYYDIFYNATKDKGIVRLDKDYNASQTILINGSNVIIEGNGYVIDAQNKSRIFYISGKNITIKNIYLKNGSSINRGGTIFLKSSTNLDIINATIENSIAEEGGAIYSNHSNINIINSTLNNNKVYDFSGEEFTKGGVVCTVSGNVMFLNSTCINNTAFCGGVVLTETGLITLNGSYFENNNASKYGGGVAYTAANIIAINSTFTNNTALRYGGALFNYQDSETYIINSTFTNNTSFHYGGAVSTAVKLTIQDSRFIDNQAIGIEDLSSNGPKITNPSSGGAISVWGEVLINNSIFTNNSASRGGVIYCYAYKDNVNIISSNFTNNHAESNGVFYITSNVLFKNSTFINNSATNGSAAIMSNNQNLSVVNSTFINNSAISNTMKSPYGPIGGVLANYGENLYVNDSTFINNSASRGGAIYNGLSGNATIENSRFENNHAEFGGAIGNINYESYYYGYGSLIVKNSEFNDNGADEGGAIYNRENPLTIDNSTFIDNKGKEGESIKNYKNETFLINSSIINKDPVNYAIIGKVNHIDSKILENGVDVTKEYVNYTRIAKKNTTLSISVKNITAGQYEIIDFTLISSKNDSINGIINVNVKEKNYNVTISKGKGRLVLSNLSVGNYSVSGSYNGDLYYNKSNASAEFKVSGTIATKIIYSNMNTGPTNVNKDGRIGNYFVVKLVDENNKPLAGLPIKIGFNGKIYDRNTTSNGVSILQINLLKEEIYTFAICFLGDDEYDGSFEVAKITVNKKYPKPNNANKTAVGKITSQSKSIKKLKTSISYVDMITSSVASPDGRIGEYFNVTLLDNNGNPLKDTSIKIGFNGKIYDRITSSDGSARLQINLPRASTYTFAIGYLGDEKYQGSFAVAKITVNKQSPKLTASSKTFKKTAKTKTISASFKTLKGNPIKSKEIRFKVNGKTYTGTTNSKGVASVKISLSKKGTYKCTASYIGDNTFKATSKKFNVKIV